MSSKSAARKEAEEGEGEDDDADDAADADEQEEAGMPLASRPSRRDSRVRFVPVFVSASALLSEPLTPLWDEREDEDGVGKRCATDAGTTPF